MKTLTEHINKNLNEGAWGFDFDENDDFLDFRDKLITNLFDEILKSLKSKDTQQLYSSVGVAIQFCEKLSEFILPIDINSLDKAISNAFKEIRNDKEWINSWDYDFRSSQSIFISLDNAENKWKQIKNSIR